MVYQYAMSIGNIKTLQVAWELVLSESMRCLCGSTVLIFRYLLTLVFCVCNICWRVSLVHLLVWQLYCLSFCDLRLLITSLVSSNFSCWLMDDTNLFWFVDLESCTYIHVCVIFASEVGNYSMNSILNIFSEKGMRQLQKYKICMRTVYIWRLPFWTVISFLIFITLFKIQYESEIERHLFLLYDAERF